MGINRYYRGRQSVHTSQQRFPPRAQAVGLGIISMMGLNIEVATELECLQE